MWQVLNAISPTPLVSRRQAGLYQCSAARHWPHSRSSSLLEHQLWQLVFISSWTTKRDQDRTGLVWQTASSCQAHRKCATDSFMTFCKLKSIYICVLHWCTPSIHDIVLSTLMYSIQSCSPWCKYSIHTQHSPLYLDVHHIVLSTLMYSIYSCLPWYLDVLHIFLSILTHFTHNSPVHLDVLHPYVI